MNKYNLLAFLCSVIGAGLSIFQTVLSIPYLYLELSFLDIMFLHNHQLLIASCVVMAVAVLAVICGLCSLLRKSKAFCVWGLALCSAVYVSAICVYTSNIKAGEAVKTTFQAWHKTYLVWGLLFLAGALFAFLDWRASEQQVHDDEDTFLPQETHTDTTTAIPEDTAALTEQAYTFLSQGNFSEAERYCREALKHNHENSAAYLGQLMAALRLRNIDDLRNVTIPLEENTLFRLAILFADDDQRTVLKKYLHDRT